MSTSESKVINNLAEFLNWQGFGSDEPYSWARAFYKYTVCGPWAVFIMADEPERVIEHPDVIARVRCVRGHAKLMNPKELDAKFVQFLGFDEHGLSRLERKWDHYKQLVDAFVADEAKQQRTGRTIEVVKRTVAELHIKHLAFIERIPAKEREIYYEDIGKDELEQKVVRCECTYEYSGHCHPDDPQEDVIVDCPPKPECRRCRGKGEYQTGVPTGRKIGVDPAKCIGIRFGSIVEGSEANSGPFDHYFPFETSAFERDEQYMEEETAYFWERDNSQWYVVRTPTGEYYLHNTWGDIKWDTAPNPRLRKKVEEFINERFDDIPREPGIWSNSQKGWKPVRIPGTRSTIHEYINDCEF